jgi:conjugal transfer pilus assembly protein TraU
MIRSLFTRVSRAIATTVLFAGIAGFADAQAQAQAQQGGGAAATTCYGKFYNPITDICWQCVFPISIGAFAVANGQEDIENPASPICFCPIAVPPYVRMGLEIGFWEPTRIIESVRKPYCFPSLNGLEVNSSGGNKPGGATTHNGENKVNADSFYQVHYYTNPLLYMLQVLIDDSCLESGSFDLAYMSEFDPQWHDDLATAIIEPESTIFANQIAQLACTADCAATAFGFGLQALFWCSGCNGPVYPMNGNVPVHIGGVQATALLNHRILAKMHRLGIAWQWWGDGAVCNGFPSPLMDKRGYKTQIIYPIAMTSGTDGTGQNRCCQPLGRSTIVYGTGREFPIRGEDFAYQVFRKRNCCLE